MSPGSSAALDQAIVLSPRQSALESFARHVCAAGVHAVAIGSGRQRVVIGTPLGEETVQLSLTSGLTVRVWGERTPLVDALMELARLLDLREQEVEELLEALTQAHDRQLQLFELGRLRMDSLDRASIIGRAFDFGADLTDSSHAILLYDDEIVSRPCGDRDPAPAWLVDAATNAASRSSEMRRANLGSSRQALFAPVPVPNHRCVIALGRDTGLAYGTAERKVIDALAGSLGASLELVEMHESSVQRAVVEHEHQTAAELATTVLPTVLPTIPGVELAARTIPARAVGGDLYTARRNGDLLLFAVGDVSGKGLPAAVVMTNAITVIDSTFARASHGNPVALLAEIHDALDRLLVGTCRFVTLCVGVVRVHDPVTGDVEVSVANAGHSPVIVVRRHSTEFVAPHAPPVGVGPAPSGPPFTCVLRPDEVLVVGSDGLSDQEDADGIMFGDDRLRSIPDTTESASEIVDAILGAVDAHAGAAARNDDQTVLIVRSATLPSIEPSEDPKVNASAPLAFGDSAPGIIMHADFEAVRELGGWLITSLREVCDAANADTLAPLVELALHELCINIVEHSYLGRGGNVEVSMLPHPIGVRFQVLDTGRPFDASQIVEPDPLAPSVRGYGMSIIRQLAAGVHYERIGLTNRWLLDFSLASDRPFEPTHDEEAPNNLERESP